VLRPPIAQERIVRGPDGLVRIALKRAFSDGTTAIDMDPLSLLSRLAASVPAPRAHTVKYAGVLAAASPPSGITKRVKLRARLVPRPKTSEADAAQEEEKPPPRTGSRYRPWAELLKRAFEVDVLHCDRCQGRMRLVALVLEDKGIARFLRALGEPTSLPPRAPARGPPYWQSRVLRRASGDDVAA
jgi:hypothetical protein